MDLELFGTKLYVCVCVCVCVCLFCYTCEDQMSPQG